jgi:hypothetical protein
MGSTPEYRHRDEIDRSITESGSVLGFNLRLTRSGSPHLRHVEWSWPTS